MSKILDSEFRKNLYTSLVEAGYEKKEAQKIVGVKYSVALKAFLVEKLRAKADNVENDKDELILSVQEYNDILSELAKMNEFLNKEKNSEKTS